MWRRGQIFSDWRVGQKARAVREVVRKEETVRAQNPEPVKMKASRRCDGKERTCRARVADPAVRQRPSGELPPLSLLTNAWFPARVIRLKPSKRCRQVELKLKDLPASRRAWSASIRDR